VYEFDAERIAGPVSTRFEVVRGRERQRARWMEASLYRKTDDTYVFTQASHSTVWHLLTGDAHVRKPVETRREELPDRAVYCGVLLARSGRPQCPPMTLDRSRHDIPGTVITEPAQHSVWALPGRDAVIRRLVLARHRDGGGTSAAVSGPMRDLLTEAAENDPAFRTGAKPVVEL
jgi:hypothetical protein